MHSQGVCPGELTCGLRMYVTSKKESMHSCLWTSCTHAVASGVEIRRQTIGAGSLLPPSRFPGYNLPHQPWQHGLCPQHHLPGPETCIPDQSPGNAGAAMQGTHLKDTGMHWCYSPTTARRNRGRVNCLLWSTQDPASLCLCSIYQTCPPSKTSNTQNTCGCRMKSGHSFQMVWRSESGLPTISDLYYLRATQTELQNLSASKSVMEFGSTQIPLLGDCLSKTVTSMYTHSHTYACTHTYNCPSGFFLFVFSTLDLHHPWKF